MMMKEQADPWARFTRTRDEIHASGWVATANEQPWFTWMFDTKELALHAMQEHIAALRYFDKTGKFDNLRLNVQWQEVSMSIQEFAQWVDREDIECIPQED